MMHTPTFDLDTPNAPPVGLGWALPPIGGTTAWWHSGGSLGGSSSLTVVPEYELVIVSFGTDPGAGIIHDHLIKVLLEDHLGLNVEPPFERAATTLTMAHYAGNYEAFESRLGVRAGDNPDELEMTTHFLPSSPEQEEVLFKYTGPAGAMSPRVTFSVIRDNLFATAGMSDDFLSGIIGRMALLSFHQVGSNPVRRYAHARFRAYLGT